MKDITLHLIPFAGDRHSREVHNNLMDLGYSVNLVQKSGISDSSLQGFKGILVCLFGQVSSSRETMLGFLSRFKQLPRYGIFVDNAGRPDNELLGHCNEFSLWPCQGDELSCRIDRFCEHMWQASALDDAMIQDLLDLNFIGRSPSFTAMVERIRKFSLCDATVLIEGETGTGKENAARAIHYLGIRKSFPFIPVNCGALPDNLIENELFGHEEGAYTDARRSGAGLIAQAEGGSLFLDEVEALSNKGQIALLRFLQDQEYRPLGGRRSVKANIRVIAASNQSLAELVRTGAFRNDLLFRLNLLPLDVPPLRDRSGDIEVLAEHFLRGYRVKYNRARMQLHPDTLEWMQRYDWPGNVRELENYIHREFLLASGDEIINGCSVGEAGSEYHNLQDAGAEAYNDFSFNIAKSKVLDSFERSYLSRLMKASQGNVTMAAKLAGKERRALGKLLKKHGIDKMSFV
jgi:DNA-binding NtrC family response regulator